MMEPRATGAAAKSNIPLDPVRPLIAARNPQVCGGIQIQLLHTTAKTSYKV